MDKLTEILGKMSDRITTSGAADQELAEWTIMAIRNIGDRLRATEEAISRIEKKLS